MKIEKNDMVMVYDGGGTVPHCKYTGRFGDLTAYWQEIVSDAVYLFRLGESEECETKGRLCRNGSRVQRYLCCRKGNRKECRER